MLQRRGFFLASVGKRFLETKSMSIYRNPTLLLVSASRSSRHFSGYQYVKNVDDDMHPSVVPEDVIEPQVDKYWAPHPETGVFGPGEEMGNGCQSRPSPAGDAASGSVLEQKAWFRPSEDVEKPTTTLE